LTKNLPGLLFAASYVMVGDVDADAKEQQVWEAVGFNASVHCKTKDEPGEGMLVKLMCACSHSATTKELMAGGMKGTVF
jgi:hypothetical protein